MKEEGVNMMKRINKFVSIVLTLTLAFSLVTSVYADSSIDDDINHNEDKSIDISSVVKDFSVHYTMNGLQILEESNFLDSDGVYVKIQRIINPNGEGQLIMTKDGQVTIENIYNQNYEMFKLICLDLQILKRGSTIGKDVTGTQYVHQKISSKSVTYKNTELQKFAVETVAAVANKVASALGLPYGPAVTVASTLIRLIQTISPYKVVISQTIYEVLFKSDKKYYTHCYHEVMKSYNDSGKLLDTTKMYKQAIGG